MDTTPISIFLLSIIADYGIQLLVAFFVGVLLGMHLKREQRKMKRQSYSAHDAIEARRRASTEPSWGASAPSSVSVRQ